MSATLAVEASQMMHRHGVHMPLWLSLPLFAFWAIAVGVLLWKTVR